MTCMKHLNKQTFRRYCHTFLNLCCGISLVVTTSQLEQQQTMGNDQSQQGRQQIIRPPESDPYTLSSVAKASNSPVAISQVSAAPVKLHEKQPTGVDDIVQVVTMESSEVESPQ